MKITLDIDLPTGLRREEFLRAAARGLTSTTDAGEAVLVALEIAAGLVAPRLTARSPEVVAAVLEAAGGNVSAASRQLGIARATVRSRAATAARLDLARAADEWRPRE